MSCEIGYFEAWSQWAAGKSISGCHLWGIKLLWWGRVGKVIQLVSAFVIVIDILGPERIDKFGDQLRKQSFPTEKLFRTIKNRWQWFIVLWTDIIALGEDQSKIEERLQSFRNLARFAIGFARSSVDNFLTTILISLSVVLTIFFMSNSLHEMYEALNIDVSVYQHLRGVFSKSYSSCVNDYGGESLKSFIHCGSGSVFITLLIALFGTLFCVAPSLLFGLCLFSTALLFIPFLVFLLQTTALATAYFVSTAFIEPVSYLLRLEDFERWVLVFSLVLLLLGFKVDLLAS